MKLKYRISESSVYPELIDTTSSKTTVYLRRNIEAKLNSNNDVYYQYQEAKLTKEEYREYFQEQVRSDVDYIALIEGINLEESDKYEDKVYYKIKKYYDSGLWNKVRLEEMVKRGIITEGQYMLITGEYIEIEE
ncbi:MAG: XkdX family protein [Caudoviricetes sp.]|nr:MAG: XkdX family protein [Caudoviricetes sp.]